VPAENIQARCDKAVFIDWACRSALKRLGFGTPADIARYWDTLSIEEVKTWLKGQNSDEITTVLVESADKTNPRLLYAPANIEEQLESLARLPERLRVLSPFDPVIRDRNRLKWLFNFDYRNYRIEIYVPAEKRKYGYYVFPLLERDRLVGRIDMRANRQENQLQVKKIWLEKGCRWSNARKQRLNSELTRQARLANVADTVLLEDFAP